MAVAVAVCYGAWVPNFTVPRRAAALGMASALWLEMAQAQDGKQQKSGGNLLNVR